MGISLRNKPVSSFQLGAPCPPAPPPRLIAPGPSSEEEDLIGAVVPPPSWTPFARTTCPNLKTAWALALPHASARSQYRCYPRRGRWEVSQPPDRFPELEMKGGSEYLHVDMCSRFDDVVTLIDREEYAGHEDLITASTATGRPPSTNDRSLAFSKKWPVLSSKKSDAVSLRAAASILSSKFLAKVDLYANSKLPLGLPPLALSGSSWPSLLRLAAQCSLRVYSPPTGPEQREAVIVPADRRAGCKAMHILSVPADARRTIVVAVRGTASFADWAVNLRADPASPLGFLDDAGNACHAGFLSVARAMVVPVARRLRQLLEDDPQRARHSLVLTGHSAAGAVAALLYMHMLALSPDAQSDLTLLAGRFRRVHCLTFGAPPVSLLPLTKPRRPALSKSLFLSFVNEGDPVTRADKAYIKSLFALLKSPPPTSAGNDNGVEDKEVANSHEPVPPPQLCSKPHIWKVPPSTLSNAGRVVLLRAGDPLLSAGIFKSATDGLHDQVEAVTCRDEQLRGVIWGDPICHMMRLYASRVERLAAAAEAASKPWSW